MGRVKVDLRDDLIAEEQGYLFRVQHDEDVAWDRAACVGADPEVFFPISQLDTRTYDRAKSHCAQCPVRVPCLQRALDDPALVGVWGGTSEAERAELRRRRSTRSLRLVS